MPAVKRGAAKPKAPPKARAGSGVATPVVALAGAAVLLVGGAAVLLATGGRAHAVQRDVDAAGAHAMARAGFTVSHIVVEGASRFSAPYIVKAAAVSEGEPLMGLDLSAVRGRVEQVGWVKSVRILRLWPDTVVLAVAERPRLAVWQDHGQALVIDPAGKPIPEADPGLFVDLPLVVGDGAAEAAGALIPDLQSRPRLMRRIDAAVRVDGRRWDLRLKDGGLIELPAVGQEAALAELDRLDQQDRVLDLGFERVDLRDPDMVVVRPRTPVTAAATPAKPASPASSPAPSPAKT